jgi:GT2 family glycosyltransferase
LRLNTNIGCPAGRHLGVKEVNTEYIYMLDDDGWLEKDALLNASQVFIDLKDRNIGAVRSFVHLTENSNIIGKSNREKKNGYYQVGNFSGGASLISKSAYINSGGYPIDFWGYGEEFDLSLSMWSEGYEILANDKSVMFHEPIQSDGRINEKYIHYIIKNTLLTVSRKFPILIVLPSILYFSKSWFLISYKQGSSRYFISGFKFFLSILFQNKIQRKKFKTVSYKSLFQYYKCN